MLSDIEHCSKALLKLGTEPISSFDEESVESEVSNGLYSSTRDALLSAHPWSFATTQMTLAKLEAKPVADFNNAFQLPSDFLRALSVGISGSGRGVDYRIHERRIHTNEDSITLTYIFRPDESAWPAFFDQVLITRLAAEFCIPITESTSRSESTFKLAEHAFEKAKSIDSQQAAPGQIDDFPLIDVRG